MNHLGDTNKMVNTPRTDEQINGKPCTRFEVIAGDSLRNASVPSEFARQLERELNEANESFRKLNIHTLNLVDRIRRLEGALDLVIPNCSWVHHSKKHQHKCGEPCPVVALIEKAKEAKP